MSAKKKVAGKKAPKKLTFEDAYSQLEEVVDSLESSQLGLTESLALYQKGVGCLKVCYQALESAERKIELLTGVNAEGEAETEPYDDEEMDLQEKALNRSRRRGATTSEASAESSAEEASGGMDDGGRLF